MAKRTGPPPTAPELDWEPMADGRPWRLKRGQDFSGATRPVQKAARKAAAQMGKAVTAIRDQSGKWDYVWVQFADYSLPEGQPCPRCGGTEMVREAKMFARCTSCAATLILEEALEEEGALTTLPEGPARKIQSEFGTILSSRLLSEDGEEIEDVSIDEDSTVEVLLRVLVPVSGVGVRVALWTEGVKAFLWRARPEVEEPGVYRLAVRLPGGLLAERSYSTDVAVSLMIGDRKVRIKLEGSPSFEAHRREDEEARHDGVLRPDLEWNLTRLSARADGAAPSPAGNAPASARE